METCCHLLWAHSHFSAHKRVAVSSFSFLTLRLKSPELYPLIWTKSDRLGCPWNTHDSQVNSLKLKLSVGRQLEMMIQALTDNIHKLNNDAHVFILSELICSCTLRRAYWLDVVSLTAFPSELRRNQVSTLLLAYSGKLFTFDTLLTLYLSAANTVTGSKGITICQEKGLREITLTTKGREVLLHHGLSQ